MPTNIHCAAKRHSLILITHCASFAACRNISTDFAAGECPLQLVSALQRPGEGDLVGVLQVAAHRDAVGQAGDLDVQRL